MANKTIDACHIPYIDNNLDCFRGSVNFNKINLMQDYYQVWIVKVHGIELQIKGASNDLNTMFFYSGCIMY